MSQLLDIKSITVRLSMGRTKIYALLAAGEFPRPLKIGRHSRWLATEIDAWIADQADARMPDDG